MPVLVGTIPRLFETGNLLPLPPPPPVNFSPVTVVEEGLVAIVVTAASISAKEVEEDGDVIEAVGVDTVGLMRKLLEDDPSAAAVLNDRRLLAAGSKPA